MRPELDLDMIDLLARAALKDGLDPECFEQYSPLDEIDKVDKLKEAVLSHGDGSTEDALDLAIEQDKFVALAIKIAKRMKELA